MISIKRHCSARHSSEKSRVRLKPRRSARSAVGAIEEAVPLMACRVFDTQVGSKKKIMHFRRGFRRWWYGLARICKKTVRCSILLFVCNVTQIVFMFETWYRLGKQPDPLLTSVLTFATIGYAKKMPSWVVIAQIATELSAK